MSCATSGTAILPSEHSATGGYTINSTILVELEAPSFPLQKNSINGIEMLVFVSALVLYVVCFFILRGARASWMFANVAHR